MLLTNNVYMISTASFLKSCTKEQFYIIDQTSIKILSNM